MEPIEITVQWKICALCQQDTGEPLKCPSDSKNIAGIREIYTNTSSLLKRFLDAGKLPQNFHPRIVTLLSSSTAENLAKVFSEKKAAWHSSCKSNITETKFLKLTANKRKSTETPAPSPLQKKTTRSQTVKFDPNTCFVPGCCVGTTDDEPLHEVMSNELDERFRYYASYMNDMELLTKLVAGDLIALEAKYHTSCALMYRNRVRTKIRQEKPASMAEKFQKFE